MRNKKILCPENCPNIKLLRNGTFSMNAFCTIRIEDKGIVSFQLSAVELLVLAENGDILPKIVGKAHEHCPSKAISIMEYIEMSKPKEKSRIIKLN